MFWWVSLWTVGTFIKSLFYSLKRNSVIPAHKFFLPSSNHINCYVNRCLLHQSLLHLRTQIFLSSYASGLKESSFDVTKEHCMPSGWEWKSVRLLCLHAPRNKEKRPRRASMLQVLVWSLMELFVLVKLTPFPKAHTFCQCLPYNYDKDNSI